LVAPVIVRKIRTKSLSRFGEAIEQLDGIEERHHEALRTSGHSASAGHTRKTPIEGDLLGNLTYNAAAFDALATAVLALQRRVEELEAQQVESSASGAPKSQAKTRKKPQRAPLAKASEATEGEPR
jgi:hypothetical protein